MRQGFVVWMTGLSGAGKTTIARELCPEIAAHGLVCEQLDGDEVRSRLFPELGYSRKDREANVERIAWLASRLGRAGAAVVVSMLSPYAAVRRHARDLCEGSCVAFVEVYVCTPLDVCAARDPKGLYAQALSGHLPEFTGVSAPYEQPTAPDLRVDTTSETVFTSVQSIVSELRERSLLQLVPVSVSRV